MPAHDTRLALEREAHELLRTIRLATDDLAAVFEQLRQLRQAEPSPDHRLVVEAGPNGRPEVVR